MAAAAANPAGFEAAHALIARTNFRSIGRGPYNDRSVRKGGFRSVILTKFLPIYINQIYPAQTVPSDHKSKIQWHNSRTQEEQDVIRLFIQQKIEDELSSVVATQVASLRQLTGSNARGLPESKRWSKSDLK
jgi:hypothetical protein